ncbi:MAG: hypothetical protein REI78_00835 [Pedobacter sp.]|nr:hypothetical protein [Pedobacter sp.]MDQ8051532.1 hypothetical protein [Pedobacter sp.]
MRALFPCLFFLVWMVTYSAPTLAATPVNGQQDCGLIVSGVFYSNAYPPPGTPAKSGTCSWTKTSNTSCGTANYGGTNYTLYPHTYICSLPLDDQLAYLVPLAGILCIWTIRRSKIIS